MLIRHILSYLHSFPFHSLVFHHIHLSDYWVHGSPSAYVPKVDQVGNGFMQYYGQDSAASFKNDAAHDATPFDFSVNPDTNAASTSPEVDSSVSSSSSSSSYANKIGRDALTSLAALHNFFHYNRIGNVAFVGFSGAYQFSDTQKVILLCVLTVIVFCSIQYCDTVSIHIYQLMNQIFSSSL